jgi:hypothetical protein
MGVNKRIKEFAEQAGFMDSWFSESGDDCERELKKFAELIVQECVNVVEGGSFLHDQAPTAIFAKECSAAIKRHFGVNE